MYLFARGRGHILMFIVMLPVELTNLFKIETHPYHRHKIYPQTKSCSPNERITQTVFCHTVDKGRPTDGRHQCAPSCEI